VATAKNAAWSSAVKIGVEVWAIGGQVSPRPLPAAPFGSEAPGLELSRIERFAVENTRSPGVSSGHS
jgi:hypothetical protein